VAAAPVTPATESPASAPAAADPKCGRLQKKLKGQRHRLADSHSGRKRSMIQGNIAGTKRRWARLGC